MSLENCKKAYHTLLDHIFERYLWSFLYKAEAILLPCITGSKYSSTGIDEVMKSDFGIESNLFGRSCSTKVAVTGTTTDDSSTVLFTSYNGKKRPEDCGRHSNCHL